MNNGYLGMVRQWQELFWDERYCARRHGRSARTSSSSPRPTASAGARLTDKTRSWTDLRAAIETEGPAFVDVRVTREENVYPMIAPGEAARDMVG